MTYKPLGHGARLIAAFERKGPMTEMTALQAATCLGITSNNLPQAVRSLILHKLLHRERRGKHVIYRVEPFEPTAAPDKFDACLWANGDLDLCGMVELDNEGWRIPAANVPKLRALLAGEPS